LAETREQAHRRETLYDLTSHPGWHMFIERAGKQIQALKDSIFNCTWDDPQVHSYRTARASAAVYYLRAVIKDLYREGDLTIPPSIEEILK
jgi:hypothetical protein